MDGYKGNWLPFGLYKNSMGLVDSFLPNVRSYFQQFVGEEISFCIGEVGVIQTSGFFFHDCLREIWRVISIHSGLTLSL